MLIGKIVQSNPQCRQIKIFLPNLGKIPKSFIRMISRFHLNDSRIVNRGRVNFNSTPTPILSSAEIINILQRHQPCLSLGQLVDEFEKSGSCTPLKAIAFYLIADITPEQFKYILDKILIPSAKFVLELFPSKDDDERGIQMINLVNLWLLQPNALKSGSGPPMV
jgi:hypothetical protein